ncbi:hypothetical protein [Paenibacillus sp. 32O-W]|uniref:hypothetical protein n=1 Tax=Paenibacillus sp. 32O-W TaxID=1695218 RepID=UPI00078068E9|nr:hypothetical protein [Paenibacillus sp. 32O-W]
MDFVRFLPITALLSAFENNLSFPSGLFLFKHIETVGDAIESIGETIGEATGEAISELIGEAIDVANGETIGETTGEATGEAIGEMIGETTGEAMPLRRRRQSGAYGTAYRIKRTSRKRQGRNSGEGVAVARAQQ